MYFSLYLLFILVYLKYAFTQSEIEKALAAGRLEEIFRHLGIKPRVFEWDSLSPMTTLSSSLLKNTK